MLSISSCKARHGIDSCGALVDLAIWHIREVEQRTINSSTDARPSNDLSSCCVGSLQHRPRSCWLQSSSAIRSTAGCSQQQVSQGIECLSNLKSLHTWHYGMQNCQGQQDHAPQTWTRRLGWASSTSQSALDALHEALHAAILTFPSNWGQSEQSFQPDFEFMIWPVHAMFLSHHYRQSLQ